MLGRTERRGGVEQERGRINQETGTRVSHRRTLDVGPRRGQRISQRVQ